MPEGDSLHRAARRLQALVGERVSVETPHPRAAALGVAGTLDGRRLESVEAVGKNLLLTFEGGLALRSHLRMTGRWQVRERGARGWTGKPWLVLRASAHEALLDQRLVAGIGNLWKAEALWRAQVSPWVPLGEASDEELERVLNEAARLMRASLEGARGERAVYRRAGRPCPRCGERIRSRGQGDDNRTAYWCPRCQRGEDRPEA